jgi:hypothetical protein
MSPGSEAMVVLPPRTRAARMRLHRIEPNGHLTFIEAEASVMKPQCHSNVVVMES